MRFDDRRTATAQDFHLSAARGHSYIAPVPSQRRPTNEDFLDRVREYLPMDASVWETDAGGKPDRVSLPARLAEKVFYLFDAEAMLAASHAIEDLAMEEATGNLWRTFPDFGDFEPHRERYTQLAATIASVHVLAAGRKPRPQPHVRFVNVGRSVLRQFWVVLYQGRRCRALLMCRQVNDTSALEDRRFVGFYTFSPQVIARVRGDVDALVGGKRIALPEFQRLRALDHASKRLLVQFDRERAAVETAVRRLRAAERNYDVRRFADDVERSLTHLHNLKERLPEMVGHAPQRPSRV